MKGYGFLFWAYAVVWAGIVGYLVFLVVRLRKTEDRLGRIESQLARLQDDDARS